MMMVSFSLALGYILHPSIFFSEFRLHKYCFGRVFILLVSCLRREMKVKIKIMMLVLEEIVDQKLVNTNFDLKNWKKPKIIISHVS